MIARKLVVLAVGALAASPADGPANHESPVALCVSHDANIAAGRGSSSGVVARALFRQLGDEQRRELIGALEESLSRHETEENPFGEVLEEGDPDARLERLAESSPEAFGTARTLVATRYCGTDGVCVRPTRGACTASEHLPRGRELERARFLAWPYAYAVRVRVADASARARAAAELRRKDGVALVLEGGATPMDADERRAIDLITRLDTLMRSERARTEGDAGRKPRDPPPAPEGDELVVVPTLKTVAGLVAEEERRRAP